MSILKKLKKKTPQADVSAIAKTMASVKKLIDMKVLQVDLEQPKFSLYPELWTGKDLKFKNNFCKNVLIWRSLTISDETPGKTLEIFEVESGNKIGLYSEKTGFINHLSLNTAK